MNPREFVLRQAENFKSICGRGSRHFIVTRAAQIVPLRIRWTTGGSVWSSSFDQMAHRKPIVDDTG